MPVSALIKMHHNQLTQTEKRLADFILQNQQQTVMSNIASLASATQLGEATIVRFCRKLGFSGFAELKRQLTAEQLQSLQPLTPPPHNPTEKYSLLDVARRLHQLNQASLDETLALQNNEGLEQAATLLLNASQVSVYGIGMSGISAREAKYRFMRIGMRIDAHTDNHTLLLNSSLVNQQDLVIAISHSGDTRDVVKALQNAKQNGACTLAITRYLHSPLTAFADVTLLTGGSQNRYESDASMIKSSQTYLIDLLFNMTLFINQGRSLDNFLEVMKQIEKEN
ncbi:MurR/RpiR family transcriptional regulator [Pantoea sp. LMR881]|uniref:MurR/RpiR family transcriptional regulator n=1 Tax=Pantoea sp. LMR881 TaxID=3014336 RepID=UPI0022B006DD|nr:MurR/RpiR family transcriptional regulator [Pantoea sp. LMR881]MCZ4060603.1 MurR/RpiR family transcriptional regulator [Pantoea sp. LMR881]